MSEQLRQRLFKELDRIWLIDPHTHINPLAPAAKNLAEVLGYHYYTELAHSAGMPRAKIEEPGLDDREKVRRLVSWLTRCDNTVQVSWITGMAVALLGLDIETLGPEDCDPLYDRAAELMARPDWAAEVLRRSQLEAVFLTNDFDDPLAGFDTTGSTFPACAPTSWCFGFRPPRSATGWSVQRGARFTTCRRWLRRSANCSSISSATARGHARFRFRQISRRLGFRRLPPRALWRRLEAGCGSGRRRPADARSLRLLDVGRALR